MRILVTIKPRMYREALAVVLHEHRPDYEVVLGDPASIEGGHVGGFAPDLVVRNDTDGVSLESLDGVAQIEVLYSDGMDARVVVGSQAREKKDMDVDDLLRVVDEVGGMVSGRVGL